MHNLIKQMVDGAPVVLDGGWGTQLQQLGLQPGDVPDRWNLTQPALVEQVARSYVEAGAAVVLTNTFGANRVQLQRHGIGEQSAQIARVGAELSKRAAGERAKVFGSLGPSGKMLIMGEVTEQELQEAFFEQAQAMMQGGVDAIVVETMSDLQEAVLAVTAAKATGLPTVACMSYDSGPHRDRTMMGVTAQQAAEALAGAGADVIGANCGQGPEGYVSICQQLKEATGLPLWAKANAGLPQLVDGRAVYQVTPQDFAQKAALLWEAGVHFLGGCCGTTPAHISALKAALERPQRN